MEPEIFTPPFSAGADADDILAGLNPQQREAVTYSGASEMIVAGAGSGKTRVLTNRIAYLIATGQVWPSQVLAITFTNKAASEMRERIRTLVGDEAEWMWVSTFHSACVRILRREADRFGYTKAFTIYDAQDSRAVLKRIVKALRADIYNITPAYASNVISKAKNELKDADAYAGSVNTDDPRQALIAEIFREYEQVLRRDNAFDFDDLIAQTVYLFRAFDDIADKYRHKFHHILVDEYQDTNRAQFALIQALAFEPGGKQVAHVTVVGDADQSIYAFRGADSRNITDFQNDFEQVGTILLEQNYRSTQNILDAANAVISNNTNRQDKRLWSAAGAGEDVVGYTGYTAHDEAQYIVDEIERLREQGVQYRDVAVLYRTNAQTRALEEIFIRSGLPYRILGGTRFYERAEVKDAIAYLQAIVNERDELSLRRILNTPKRGIGPTTETTLAKWASDFGAPLSEALAQVGQLGFGPKLTKSIAEFSKHLEQWRVRAATEPVDKLVAAVLEESGYLDMLRDSKDPQDESRLENLTEFVSVAAEFQASNPESNLVDFLTDVSLVAAVDELDDQAGTVQLMTLHTAKGLEFPVVFLTGLEEELLPHRMSMNEPGGMSEERRLMYVGITRARQRLYLTLAMTRTTYEGSSMQAPSRFLEELPEGLVHWVQAPMRERSMGVREISGERRDFGSSKPKTQWPGAITRSSVRDNSGLELAVGDRIHHDSFGDGTVMAVAGAGAKAVAEVRFDIVGKKKLMVKIAPIEKL